MKRKLFFMLSLLIIVAQPQAKDAPTMAAIAEWAGPFKETVITKYADYSDGVACYVYSPKNIGTSMNCNAGRCATQFKGDIGSISCVKVTDFKSKAKK